MEGHISKRKNRWIRRNNQQGVYYHLMNKAGEGAVDDSETSGSEESLGQVSAVCEAQDSDVDIFESGDDFDEADARSCQGEELDDAFMHELLSSEPKPQNKQLVDFNPEGDGRRKRARSLKIGGPEAAVLQQSYMEEKRLLADVTKDYLHNVPDLDEKQAARKFELVKIPEKHLQFDCESMLSSYSNTNNRPSVILPEQRPATPGTSRDRRPAAENTLALSDNREIPVRHPQESKDEKKERRKMVKAIQAEKRRQKKALSEMYKSEGIRQSLNRARVGSGVRNFKLG